MTKVKTIEELAKLEIDISEYGLKAEGLAILHRYMHELRQDPANRDEVYHNRLKEERYLLKNAEHDFERKAKSERVASLERLLAAYPRVLDRNFEVDQSFVVPSSVDIDCSDVEAHFDCLSRVPTNFLEQFEMTTKGYKGCTPMRIAVARSSSENELPGKFQTHFSLFDPENRKGSFRRWLAAADKVRSSGAKAVIAQMLVASPSIPSEMYKWWRHDESLADMLRSGELTNTPKFGLSSYSFVANSGGPYGRHTPTITAVAGLCSKIVRGDHDYSLLIKAPDVQCLHMMHGYLHNFHSIEDLPQENMDFIDIDDPSVVRTMPYFKFGSMQIDSTWGTYAFPMDSMHPLRLMEIVADLDRKLGSHVEIEGTILEDEFFPHFLQLRKYELPENRLDVLTDMPESRRLTIAASYVADKFSGDLVVFKNNEKTDLGSLKQRISDRSIIMTPYGHIPYESFSAIDLEMLDPMGIILPVIEVQRSTACHTFGFMMCVLANIQKKRNVIAIYDNPSNIIREAQKRSQSGIEIFDNCAIIRDVTAESDGKLAQIYLNH